MAQVDPQLQDEIDLRELLSGEDWTADLARKLTEEFPEETATEILARIDADPRLVSEAPKPKTRKDGTKAPKRAKPSNEPTRQLALFPAYRISERGDVWGPRGKKLGVRWYKSIPHVVLYDHEGKRHENRVYWLLVGAGWLKDPRG